MRVSKLNDDIRFVLADATAYSRWAFREFWTLEEAARILAGYYFDEYRFGDVPSDSDIVSMKHIINFERTLREGVQQEQLENKMSPLDWVTFAFRRDLPVPQELAKFFPDGVSLSKRFAQLQSELVDLKTKLESVKVPNARAETTYLNIIAALLEYIEGRLPDVEKHPSFKSEAKLIEGIAEHFQGFGGLSKSNLSRKFPEARRSIKAQ